VNFPGQLSIIFAKQNDHYNNDNGYMSSLGEEKGRVLSNSEALGKFSYYGIPGKFLDNYWQQLIVFWKLDYPVHSFSYIATLFRESSQSQVGKTYSICSQMECNSDVLLWILR